MVILKGVEKPTECSSCILVERNIVSDKGYLKSRCLLTMKDIADEETIKLCPMEQLKTGIWISLGAKKVKCSCCGYRREKPIYYCPHCGAKMKGERDGSI